MMDLIKNGKLLCGLRKSKGMTQKQLADILGIVPKTVSKWETGNGFPDISILPKLSDALGVSERSLLDGNITQNKKDVGNLKLTKFYVCPYCGSFMQGTGKCRIVCCGMPVDELKPKSDDGMHTIRVSLMENDFYIEFSHDMTKEHHIGFVAYVGMDRVMTMRLYPEQDPSIRIPRMYGGKFYYFCNKDGLFEYKNRSFKNFKNL